MSVDIMDPVHHDLDVYRYSQVRGSLLCVTTKCGMVTHMTEIDQRPKLKLVPCPAQFGWFSRRFVILPGQRKTICVS